MPRLRGLFGAKRVRIGVSALLLIGGAVTLTATIDRRPEWQRAHDWVAAHQGVLPQTLEEYAAYPTDYQNEIRHALSPNDLSRLWREQLGMVLARPNLTDKQRAFLHETIAMATPEAFGPLANPPDVCPQVAALFPDVNTRRMFLRLGAMSTPKYTWRTIALAVVEKVHEKIDANADQSECNCRGLGLCECGLMEGCQPTPGCTPSNNCGCIFAGPCDSSVCVGLLDSMTNTANTSSKTVK
jgi:hypothetical protein